MPTLPGRRDGSQTPRSFVMWVLAVSCLVIILMTMSFGRTSLSLAPYADATFRNVSLFSGSASEGEGGNGSGVDAREIEEINPVKKGEEVDEQDGSEDSEEGPEGEEPELTLEEAKLEFAKQEMGRTRCLRDMQESLREAFRPYVENATGVALVDVALHTNLGDNILWRAAIKLLTDFKKSPGTVCYLTQPSWTGMDQHFPKCTLEKTVKIAGNGGVVLFHAGGNWGDLYRFVPNGRLPFLAKLSDYSKSKKFKALQLPQSIYYTPGSSYVHKDDQILASLERDFFTLFVRNKQSYEYAQRHYKTTKTVLTPDIAFILGPLQPSKKPEYDVIIQLRQDREVQDEDKKIWDWVWKVFQDANMTFRVQDWWYKHDKHPGEYSSGAVGALSEVRLNAAVDVISQGKIVITNRLHGSIVASLLGKHLFYVDTKEGKLGEVRTASFAVSPFCSPDNLHSHRAESMREAVEGAIALYKRKGENFVYN